MKVRHRPYARVVATTAKIVTVLVVVALAVAVRPTRRAAAEDGFASVSPAGVIGRDAETHFTVTYTTGTTPAHVTIKVNGSTQAQDDPLPDGQPHQTTLDSTQGFDCVPNNSIEVAVDYHGLLPAKSQTLPNIVVLCPSLTVSPEEVVGPGPVTVSFSGWDGNGSFDDGFDSLGPYTDPAGAKRLYLDGTQLGDPLGYKVAPPAVSVDATCGDHVFTLTQPSPYGLIEASDHLMVSCTSWTAQPHGLISPTQTDAHDITLSSPTVYPQGTTATATIVGESIPLGTMTADSSGHLSGTFSDSAQFRCPAFPYHINVHIVEPDPTPPAPPAPPRLKFAELAAPTVIDERIPFSTLCPYVDLSQAEVGQQFQPFTQKVTFHHFDGPVNPYDARDVQPKTVSLNGVPVATTTDADAWPGSISGNCGQNTVEVSQPTSIGLITEQATFTVLCPQVSAAPTVIASGSQPHAVAVSGTGFHPTLHDEGATFFQPYVITVDGKQLGDGDMDDSGAFSTSITASGLGCGTHDVTVTEQPRRYQGPGGVGFADRTATARTAAAPTGAAPTAAPTGAAPAAADPDGLMTASAPLTVNCPPPPPGQPRPGGHTAGGGHLDGEVVTTPGTTLAVNPQGIIAGMRTFVTGTGFTPAATVTLSWRLPNGELQPACPGATATVLADGTVATLCLVPQPSRLGRRELIANDGNRSAAAYALIISSSMQPSRHHDRFVIRR